jgi:hypothetical protein
MADTSHLLVFATTIFLRCIVEMKDLSRRNAFLSRLLKFQQWLERAKAESSWDLANLCIERCGESISKVAAAMDVLDTSILGSMQGPPMEIPENTTNATVLNGVEQSFQQSEIFDNFEPPNYPWETLWDWSDGIWPGVD